MPDAVANFSYSTVATAPSPATSGTSLVVASGDGARFPAVPFNAVVWPVSAQPLASNAEIVRVTAISTDTLTITRTQESTSARTITVGDQIAAAVTAKTLTDLAFAPAAYYKPAAVLYESYSRLSQSSGFNTAGSSGQLFLTAVAIPSGTTIGHIGFVTNGAATSPTHWWAGLYDSSKVQLAISADQTTTAIGANSWISLAIATTAAGAATSFTTTYTGLHYVGVMIAATSVPSMVSVNTATPLFNQSPILAGSADSAQTTPPAFPHTAGAFSTTTTLPYVFVGA